jgi:type II secretory pathway component PulJ
MISLTISSVMMLGLVTFHGLSVNANVQTMAQARLTQDMRSLMDIMTRDIRKSGYQNGAATAATGTQINRALVWIDGPTNGNDCILYSYDGAIDGFSLRGFRRNGNVVEWLRDNAGDCDGAGNWTPITDADVFTVDALQFVDNSTCFNLTQNNDCNPCGGNSWNTGDTISRVREVQITLNATTTGGRNPVVTQLSDTVRVANDEYGTARNNGGGGGAAACNLSVNNIPLDFL